MAEENQVTKEPQGKAVQLQQVVKEPQGEAQRVTIKNPKKVEVGKRLAAHNRKKREEKRKEQVKLEKTASGVNQYNGIGAVIALGVIGGLGYYIYRTKKERNHKVKRNKIILNHTLRGNHKPTSLRWIKSFLYYKNGQEEYSK